MFRKLVCSAGSFLKAPVKQVVDVVDPCFLMPRMAMHMCSASIITATPRGFNTSSITWGSVCMRKLAEPELVKKALDLLTGRARIKRTMWSRRAQEYEAKINSGDLLAVTEVVRDLFRSEAQPEQIGRASCRERV